MIRKQKVKGLKKELKLFDVYAIALGTTLSAGFFLLPGLAAEQAGSAIVLSYMIAAIPLIPAMFSIIELTTAMPRAGGIYYSLDRTLGPIFGTIGGIGTWLALILKVSFALIGMGAYLRIFFPEINIVPLAIILSLILGAFNYFSAKKSGRLQVYLVIGLLFILIIFIGGGSTELNFTHFHGFFDAGSSAIISTAGMVYISYVGVTNVASLSEEVKDPEKNLPKGVILALVTAIIIYGLGTAIMVGVLPAEKLIGSLTPVAEAAEAIFGYYGTLLLSIAALLAFISVANAGTMSASRYPLAMSRDFILPQSFKIINKFGTPTLSIIVTVALILLVIIFLDPMKIAKLASAFQLILFGMICLAVIVMRESKIESYDPGFKSPFYPWMQIFGILSALWLIAEMGLFSIIFSVGLILVGFLWYRYYARDKITRTGAVFHVFERLGRSRHEGLDIELREILKEKGLRQEDPFDEIITRSFVIDTSDVENFDDVVRKVADLLSQTIPLSSNEILKKFIEGTRLGATPVILGVALPHFKSKSISQAEMVLVRSKKGIIVECHNTLDSGEREIHKVNAMFFLVSPRENPTQHLRILAQIAGRVEEDSFSKDWFAAKNEQKLKEALLLDERFVSMKLQAGTKNDVLIEKMLRNINIPVGCLIAILRRGSRIIIPHGNTILKEGDRITIIGDAKGLKQLKKLYLDNT